MATSKKTTTPARTPVSRGTMLEAYRSNMKQYAANLPFNAQVPIQEFRDEVAKGSTSIDRLLTGYAEKAYCGELILQIGKPFVARIEDSPNPLAVVEELTKLRDYLNRELLDGCFRSSSNPMSNTQSMWKGMFFGVWVKELDGYLKPYNDLLVMSEQAFEAIYG